MASKFHGYLWPVSLLELDDALFIRGRAYRIHRHHRSDALSMGGSTRRRRFATKFCEEYVSVDGTGSIFIFEFTILAPHPSILSRPFELRRLADRINLIAEHGFRFLHSMIDRSIDRSSFSSIFKSNYFFFYENNKNTKNDLSWNLFFFNITIKFFSTGDEFFIGIF